MTRGLVLRDPHKDRLAPNSPSGLARQPQPSQPQRDEMQVLDAFALLSSCSFTPQVTEQPRRPLQQKQMHIETDTANTLSLLARTQMRTAKNHQKLHRNYRSQIRADAERRRGAP